MVAELTAQIIKQLSTANSVLIICPALASADALGAGLALGDFLRKLEKEVMLVSPSKLNAKLAFLPGFSDIKTELNLSKSFVIDLSTKQSEIDELSYHKEIDKLAIFIKPKTGQFTKADVSFRNSKFPFDIIITVSVFSLEQLDQFYAQNTELFFETPILNIDHKAGNEQYGQFNLVDLNATSTSEVVLDLISAYEANFIDANIATNLLAGIVAETNSFQHARTTPQAFLKASQLISLGGRQQEIIAYFYKNRSLALLKLWGRVLARLKYDPALSLVYSAVNQQDIVRSEASEEEVANIIKEMTGQLTMAKTFLFLRELSQEQSEAYAASSLLNLSQIFVAFKPSLITPGIIRFITNQTLVLSEQQILSVLKQEISRFEF